MTLFSLPTHVRQLVTCRTLITILFGIETKSSRGIGFFFSVKEFACTGASSSMPRSAQPRRSRIELAVRLLCFTNSHSVRNRKSHEGHFCRLKPKSLNNLKAARSPWWRRTVVVGLWNSSILNSLAREFLEALTKVGKASSFRHFSVHFRQDTGASPSFVRRS